MRVVAENGLKVGLESDIDDVVHAPLQASMHSASERRRLEIGCMLKGSLDSGLLMRFELSLVLAECLIQQLCRVLVPPGTCTDTRPSVTALLATAGCDVPVALARATVFGSILAMSRLASSSTLLSVLWCSLF